MECVRHGAEAGILANFYHPEPPIPERDFNESLGELCLSKTPIPRECCKKLGLKPKRDDFEYDYDNDAEIPITRIRVDFLGDDHYRATWALAVQLSDLTKVPYLSVMKMYVSIGPRTVKWNSRGIEIRQSAVNTT
ncbi:hypothetical protein ACTXT7_002035 [Hymenolepis weldensis]